MKWRENATSTEGTAAWFAILHMTEVRSPVYKHNIRTLKSIDAVGHILSDGNWAERPLPISQQMAMIDEMCDCVRPTVQLLYTVTGDDEGTRRS